MALEASFSVTVKTFPTCFHTAHVISSGVTLLLSCVCVNTIFPNTYLCYYWQLSEIYKVIARICTLNNPKKIILQGLDHLLPTNFFKTI